MAIAGSKSSSKEVNSGSSRAKLGNDMGEVIVKFNALGSIGYYKTIQSSASLGPFIVSDSNRARLPRAKVL
jgi:hypothetical protein